MNKPSPTFWFLVLSPVCIVVWLLGPGNGFRSSGDARRTEAFADLLGGLKTALDRFTADCGRYPMTTEGFQALVICPTNISKNLWKGPYLDRVPLDPWGHEYVYRCPGVHNTNTYDIYSKGPDGISKSGGNDPDDLGNWMLRSVIITNSNSKDRPSYTHHE